MRIQNSVKKISAIIMMFAMIFSVFTISGSKVTVKAADSPVKMYCCDLQGYYKYNYQYTVYIQIDAGSAANKAVYVHHSVYVGDWEDTPATYVKKLDDNTELWKATVYGENTSQYAIKYVGDGQTYWDNNNGKNYTTSDILGQVNVKANRLSHQTPAYYSIQTTVRNLDYTKIVRVRYTLDNWNTYQDADLSYQYSDNGTDTEKWLVTLNLDEDVMDSFHYCIYYQVNGQTYWDNNFGENYDKDFEMKF